MKTKFLSLILLTTILTAIIVSAAVSFTVSPATLIFTQTANSIDFNVTNTDEAADFTIPSVTITDGTNDVSVALSKSSFNLGNGSVDPQTQTITASVNAADIDKLEPGIYSTIVDISAMNGENSTYPITFQVHRSYCEEGPSDASVIEIRDVDESGSSSDDDWAWYPQDEITLSMKIKNNDDDDDHEVRVEWDLYDTNAEEFLDIGDDDTVDVNDNDYEWIDFTFDVPYDLERGSNYLLFVKAYDDDEGENSMCSVATDNGKSAALGETEGIPVEIKRERNDVDITKSNIPDLLSCGAITDIDLWIANIGRSREDKIKVTLLDSVFGTVLSREISKLDWDDKAEKVNFPLSVPEDIDEGMYTLKFRIDLDYDEDDDEYGRFKTISYDVEVKGNCIVKKTSDASITAELDSDVVAGEELVIKGTLENTGGEETTYVLSVSDYNSWADFKRIEPRTITLAEGDSKDFYIYLNIDEDAIDEQFFTITADYDDEKTEQEVSVVVEGGKQAGITGAAVSGNLRENWFIWVIVVINVILIIAIILVARRIVSTK